MATSGEGRQCKTTRGDLLRVHSDGYVGVVDPRFPKVDGSDPLDRVGPTSTLIVDGGCTTVRKRTGDEGVKP